MIRYESLKIMSLDEMVKAIIELSADCSDCEGGCKEDDYGCFVCTRSRLRDEEEEDGR